MKAVTIYNQGGSAGAVLTCEHASCAVPAEYRMLGVSDRVLKEHVGWDIGAATLARRVADRCDAAAVLAGVSRLVIDCNRALSDPDLILAESHGYPVPGNRFLAAEDRKRRISEFYAPYHDAVDRVLSATSRASLLSLHSFTPVLDDRERDFDAGVLFDVYQEDATVFGAALARFGLKVRYNEPYSGLDGLIHSARLHGGKHRRRYLELEVNNRLLRDDGEIGRVAEAVAGALSDWMEVGCD